MKSIFKEYLVQPNINIFEKFQTIIKELEKIKSEINYHYFIVILEVLANSKNMKQKYKV